MDFTRVPGVVELRQYALRPGARETLIDLFEREFVEPQESAGALLLGQFRVREDPDRFVWLRGFADMAVRERALRDFYTGPVWKRHRAAANATMLDSDNVLLLRPARPFSGITLQERRNYHGDADPRRALIATICSFDSFVGDDVVEDFERRIIPRVEAAGGAILGYYVTEPSANTYPALPVRERANVFVWLASFADRAAYEGLELPQLERALSAPPEVWTLLPTARSRLR